MRIPATRSLLAASRALRARGQLGRHSPPTGSRHGAGRARPSGSGQTPGRAPRLREATVEAAVVRRRSRRRRPRPPRPGHRDRELPGRRGGAHHGHRHRGRRRRRLGATDEELRRVQAPPRRRLTGGAHLPALLGRTAERRAVVKAELLVSAKTATTTSTSVALSSATWAERTLTYQNAPQPGRPSRPPRR